jgi:uncharacterized protein (DUF302 family)
VNAGEGIISKASSHSVPETLDKLEGILREKGIKVFVRIDHSGEAKKAGLEMPPTQLLIFGNPKGGTPIMLASPTAAIDLPLKALAWQDGQGKVWLSYSDPEYLKRRFGLSDELVQPISGVGVLIEKAAA